MICNFLNRQPHLKSSAFIYFACYADCSLMFLDKFFAKQKPQTNASLIVCATRSEVLLDVKKFG